MKMKKALLLVVSALLLMSITVVGTLAYLTDTDEVKNTFTVGKVVITLDEAPVDDEGQATDGERVKANAYQLYPGKEYDKDPTVHVAADSEDCWLYVTVANGIAAIEAEDNTIADQMAAHGWTEVAEGVYAYEAIVSANANVVVFENFAIAGSVDEATLAQYATAEIVIKAYAVQAEGFGTAAAAWTAAAGELGF